MAKKNNPELVPARITTSIAGAAHSHEPGDIVNLPPRVFKAWKADGLCEDPPAADAALASASARGERLAELEASHAKLVAEHGALADAHNAAVEDMVRLLDHVDTLSALLVEAGIEPPALPNETQETDDQNAAAVPDQA